MASITIRNLDEEIKAKLKRRAKRYGRSMEEEVRLILSIVLAEEEIPKNLGEVIHQRFLAVEGFDLPSIEREAVRDRSLFDDA